MVLTVGFSLREPPAYHRNARKLYALQPERLPDGEPLICLPGLGPMLSARTNSVWGEHL